MGKLNNLPEEILQEIVSKLPTESVLECKVLCKTWRRLVRHPSFSQMHLTHLTDHDPASKLTFLTLTVQEHRERQQFHYMEYTKNDDDDDDMHSITRININPPFDGYRTIGSSNGLICLSACYDSKLCDYQPAYICNPITKEYIILPKFCKVRNPNCRSYSGFGYLRETNEYKVVRIYHLWGESNFQCVEVYTLGIGKGWRNLGDCGLSFTVDYFVKCHGVFANETLYWNTRKGKIVGFDLADEKFCELPALPCPSLPNGKERYYEIGVLVGGFLWCSNTQYRAGKTDIWLLKKRGNQNMMEQEEYLSFTRDAELDDFDMKPLALIKSGEVLLSSYTHLYLYDIKSSCLKKLFNFPQRVGRKIPHMNTLISLKALGEVDTKSME